MIFFSGNRRRASWAVLGAVLLTLTGCAAQSQSSDAAELDVIKAYLVNGFERAKAWDVSMAEAIPDSAMGWAPTPGVRGFAAQVVHAANNTFIGMPMFGEDAPALGDPDALAQNKADLIAAVTNSYDWIIQQLNAMPGSELAAEAQLFGQTLPRWRIGMFALEHAMWTRGQLVPYLHAHGVAVPQQRLF